MNYLFKDEKATVGEHVRLTKAQAFHDLLTRQNIAAMTNDASWLIIGYKSLAADWRWNRDTVSRFIDRLVEENAAVTCTFWRKTAVILLNVSGLPELPSEILKALSASQEKSDRHAVRTSPDDAFHSPGSEKQPGPI